MTAQVEFYVGNANKFIACLKASAVPRKGEFINIRKTTYLIRRVDWAVDHSDNAPELRANVVLDRQL